MKNLFVSLAPVVASILAASVIRNSNETAKPHRISDKEPIGESRSGDSNNPVATLSFWQLDPQRESKFQL
jgi:hypothetical protein